MGDRCFRNIEAADPVHERRRTERRISGQSRIDKHAGGFRDLVGIGRGQFHEQIVRMLTIDQRRAAVGGFAASEQQRISVRAHQRVRRQHRTKAEGAGIDLPFGHRHHHAADEGLAVAARPALIVVDAVEHRVPHRHPLAVLGMDAFMRRRIRLPACARSLAAHAVGAEQALHLMTGMHRAMIHRRMIHRRHVRVGGRVAGGRLFLFRL